MVVQHRTCANPKCNIGFTVPKPSDKKKYHNQSCATSHSNSKRGPMSQDQKDKLSKANTGKIVCSTPKSYIGILSRFKRLVVGPYTPVRLNKCKQTGVKFYHRNYRKYCNQVIYSNRIAYAQECKFSFALHLYPNLDGLHLLKENGMYHPTKNSKGVSRDHLFSISDGWSGKVDFEILKHPANCRIVLHTTNQVKHAKSNITLEQLLAKIYVWTFRQELHLH